MPDFDDWIDAQLRNVPLPPDLLWRLADCRKDAPHAPTDARLERVLAGVPVPDDLEARLRRIAMARRPTPRWRPYGLVASLVFALGAAGYLGLVALAPAIAPSPQARSAVTSSPASGTTASKARITRGSTSLRADRAPRSAPSSPSEHLAPARRRTPPSNPVALTPTSTDSATDNPPTSSTINPPRSTAQLPFSLADVGALAGTIKKVVESHSRSHSALGAGGAFGRLPKLEAYEAPLARGIAPPRVRGYDLMFQLKRGEHPFASPAAHKLLASSRVPFSFRTTSFDQAVATARDGRLPSCDEIRVEDFLAAQDYLLPAAQARGLALHVALCPSPFGAEGLHLLQVAVKAPARKATNRRPARLLVILETSSRMAEAGRWDATLRALAALAGDMVPADRVTLVGYAEQARMIAEAATPGELEALISGGSLPRPSGSAHFSAAAAAANKALRTQADGEQLRGVLITAGRALCGKSIPACLVKSQNRPAEGPVPWRLICLSSDETSSRSAVLAHCFQAEIVIAASASEIRAALAEQLSGKPAPVARRTSLTLSFNPSVVTGYRLVGHASATITGEAGDPLEADLQADQTATALYELWIKPGGTEPIATAELFWDDPQGAQPRRVTRPIRREHIAPSFSDAAPWLQQGIIAAKAAEALRGSYYAPSSRPVEKIEELAGQVSPQVAEQTEFQSLLRLLKQGQSSR